MVGAPARLGAVLPELAGEIAGLLAAAGEWALAQKVEFEPFHRWCGCRDDFCQSFYTRTPPGGPYGPGHRSITLNPTRGTINLEVVGDDVRYVEVIGRPELPGQFRPPPRAPEDTGGGPAAG